MRTFRRLLAACLALPLTLALACSGAVPLKSPPQPEDLDQLEPALSEWIWRGLKRVENNPGDIPAFLSLCQMYDANELSGSAVKCYEQLLAAKPDHAKTLFYLAQARWNAGDHAGAIETMQRSIEQFPHYGPAYTRLGRWYLEMGELDAAEKNLKRVGEIDPDGAVWRISLAQVLLEREDPGGAADLLKLVLVDHPGHVAALIMLDEARRQGGGAFESIVDLDLPLAEGRMLGNDPWAAELDMFVVGYSARLNVADEYLEQGQPQTAAEVLEIFLEDDPGNVRAMIKLGVAYLRLGRAEDAKAVLLEAVSFEPDDYRAHLELSSVFMATEDPQTALGHVDRVIELKPELALAHSRRGAILRSMTRYADAIVSFERAEELSPDEKMIPRAIGDCYTRMSDWSQSAASYERALKLDATDPGLYSRAGFAYVKLGRLEDAEEAFTQALVHDSPRADAVKKMLEQVRRMREAS